MCVAKNGKEAITHYEVIDSYKDYSLVKYSLETGRTHQIRVHSTYINHPLLGDITYGGNYLHINRVALHSYEVCFTHPISKKNMVIKCELPLDMEKLRNK